MNASASARLRVVAPSKQPWHIAGSETCWVEASLPRHCMRGASGAVGTPATRGHAGAACPGRHCPTPSVLGRASCTIELLLCKVASKACSQVSIEPTGLEAWANRYLSAQFTHSGISARARASICSASRPVGKQS